MRREGYMSEGNMCLRGEEKKRAGEQEEWI